MEERFNKKILELNTDDFNTDGETSVKYFGYKIKDKNGYVWKVVDFGNILSFIKSEIELAVVNERERIEGIFKESVPKHAMNLEDGVWLKRLLNKVFKH